MDKLLEAKNNRYACSCCGNKINEGEKYFRDAKQAWRSSHTVNICFRCITKMFLSLNINEEEIGKIRKEIIIEKL